jgi:hypothetical protein
MEGMEALEGMDTMESTNASQTLSLGASAIVALSYAGERTLRG